MFLTVLQYSSRMRLPNILRTRTHTSARETLDKAPAAAQREGPWVTLAVRVALGARFACRCPLKRPGPGARPAARSPVPAGGAGRGAGTCAGAVRARRRRGRAGAGGGAGAPRARRAGLKERRRRGSGTDLPAPLLPSLPALRASPRGSLSSGAAPFRSFCSRRSTVF